MSKENKVEYKRVDEEGDKFKRILVKFNPHSLRGSDFEIEFIPIANALEIGIAFIKEIDSMSTTDLMSWDVREEILREGSLGLERGSIPPKGLQVRFYYQGVDLHQLISRRIKRVFEGIKEVFSEGTSYIYNYFLWSGELGSLPFANEDFNIEKLRVVIEEGDYLGFTAEGEEVRRSLVEHLFDTHKTEYIQANICRFLEILRLVTKQTVEEYDKKQRQ